MLDDLLSRAANGTPTITVTLTRGNRESLNLEQRTMTLDEFYERLSIHPVVSDKNTAEAIIPGVIGMCSLPCRNFDRPKSVDCGGGKPHRLMENVREISALFIDLDNWSQADVETYCNQARNAGLEFFAYSSYSYSPPEHANCRVVLPLDKPLAVVDGKHWRKVVWPTLVRRAGLNPDQIDAQCSDASRLYYLPCRRADGAPVWTSSSRGQRLDTSGISAPAPRTLSIVNQSPAAIADVKRDAFWLALRAESYGLVDLSLISRAHIGSDISIDGQRHAGVLALTRLMALAYPGNDWESLESFVLPCLEALGDERDFVSEAERAFEGAKHNLLRNEPVSPEAVDYEGLREERRGLDTGLARRFARLHAGDVRKLKGSKDTWFIRQGSRWQMTSTGAIMHIARDLSATFRQDQADVRAELDVLKAQAPEVQGMATAQVPEARTAIERFQNKLIALEAMLAKTLPRTMDLTCSADTLTRFLRLVSEQPDMQVDTTQIDSADYLLSAPNGSVDLRNGQIVSEPKEYLTKVTAADYRPYAEAPVFTAALNAALPDPEVRAFFQRAVGYAITGSIKEQKMFFLVGEGGNGKSTLLVAILRALGTEPGGYAGTTPKSAVVDSHAFSAKDYQTADLRGLRVVQVMELGSRERLASDRVKQITGGDHITAARKFENQITFRPVCKLFMPCNVMPQVSEQDHGTWRRLVVIPFTQRLDGSGSSTWNANIQDQLDTEREGILAWAVQGSVQWYREGLRAPDACKVAVSEYRDSEDSYLQFFKECITLVNTGDTHQAANHTPGSQVYQTYRAWCEDNGYKPASAKALNANLDRILKRERADMAVQHRRTNQGLTWLNLTVRNG
jgi:P4 family phage/plasmid primase-like protien